MSPHIKLNTHIYIAISDEECFVISWIRYLLSLSLSQSVLTNLGAKLKGYSK